MNDKPSLGARIDRLADEFDAALHRGETPRIEDFLREGPASERTLLLEELLGIELEVRIREDADITVEYYYARFSDEIEVVDRVMGRLSQIAKTPMSPTVVYSPADTTSQIVDAQPARGELREIGGYEILEEIARGGMGVVYKARQKQLNRVVALKLIKSGELAGDEEVQRFRYEAEAAAQLDHPNIVPIYEVGEENGQHFFSMGFVDGAGLDSRLKDGPLPPREAAELIKTIAEAVQYAHEKGIVHRDLKPANVLLADDRVATNRTDTQTTVPGHAASDQDDARITTAENPLHAARVGTAGLVVPKITDFGLAKNVHSDSGMTATGQVMGTPSYMPPEQAAGKIDEIGPLADVYSLGALLYAALTGRPPFQAANVLETLKQVVEQEPVPPRQMNVGIDRDLQTICLKALAKDPLRRYSTGSEFAADLSRYLQRKPILARPIGNLEKVRKWIRREPTKALLVGIGALVAIGLVAGGAAYNGTLRNFNSELQQKISEVSRARDQADRAKKAETGARLVAERNLTDMYTGFGLMAHERNDPAQAMLWFANAALSSNNDEQRRRNNLSRVNAWKRQLDYVPYRFLREPAPHSLILCEFHPEREFVLFLDRKRNCQIWDFEKNRLVHWPTNQSDVCSAAWSPDGKWVVFGRTDGSISFWDFPTKTKIHELNLNEPTHVLTFSHSGRYLAVAGRQVLIWECATRKILVDAIPHPGQIVAISFDDSETAISTACTDWIGRVFDLPARRQKTIQPRFAPFKHRNNWSLTDFRSSYPVPPRFIDSGRQIVTVPDADNGLIAVIDAQTGAPLRDIRLDTIVYTLEVSPDKRLVVVGCEEKVGILQVDQGRIEADSFHHDDAILSVTFDPHTNVVVLGTLTSGCDVCKYDSSGLIRTSHLGIPDNVKTVRLSNNGRFACVMFRSSQLLVLKKKALPARDKSYRTNGDTVVLRTNSQASLGVPTGTSYQYSEMTETQAIDLNSGRRVGKPLSPGGILLGGSMSPVDDRVALITTAARNWPTRLKLLAAGADHGALTVWNWNTGQSAAKRIELDSEPRDVCFSPDGRLLALLVKSGKLLVLESKSGKLLRTMHCYPLRNQNLWSKNEGLAFSPRGDELFVWGNLQHVFIWNVKTGQLRRRFDFRCHTLSISRDQKFFATLGMDGRQCVWHYDTCELAGPVVKPGGVWAGTFSDDGRYLLNDAGLWDWRTGQRKCPPFEKHSEVLETRFVPGTTWAATISTNGIARVYDTSTGKPITPQLRIDGKGYGLAVSSDGRRLYASGELPQVQCFDIENAVTVDDRPVEHHLALGELLTGQRIHVGGSVTLLSFAKWKKRYEDVRRNGLLRDITDNPGASDGTGQKNSTSDSNARQPVAAIRPIRTRQMSRVRAAIEADELNLLAFNLFKRGRIRDAYAQHLQARKLNNMVPTFVADLYVRTLDWSKAADVYIDRDNPNDWKTLMLLYEAGRFAEFQAGRKTYLNIISEKTEEYILFHAARIAGLMPVESELRDKVRMLIRNESDPKLNDDWRQIHVGLMVYRLGNFRTWYRSLPTNSPLRKGNELLVAITEFQHNASAANRRRLQTQTRIDASLMRKQIKDGMLALKLHYYVRNMSIIREAKRVLGDRNAEETGRHIRAALAIESRARSALKQGKFQQALKLYEQAGALPGEQLNLVVLRDLFARRLQWSKAADAYLASAGRAHPCTLTLLYQAGRIAEYRKARVVAMKNFTGQSTNTLHTLARAVSLLPFEKELQAPANELADLLRKSKAPEAWRRTYCSRLMFYLGRFEEWSNAEGSDVRQTRDNRLLAAILLYRKEPTMRNRKNIEFLGDIMQRNAERLVKDGQMTSPWWPNYVALLSYCRDAKTALGTSTK